MTRDMSNKIPHHSQAIARAKAGSRLLLGCFMSMLRVWLEYGWSMARVWLGYAKTIARQKQDDSKTEGLGLRLTCDEITARASRDYGSCPTGLRLVVTLLLILVRKPFSKSSVNLRYVFGMSSVERESFKQDDSKTIARRKQDRRKTEGRRKEHGGNTEGPRSAMRVLRYAAILILMMFMGVNSMWGEKKDYWFFIVNKSGKIVTYAKANLEQTNNANGNQIPAAIKSVNATNWRLYNGDQLASNLENITLPSGLPQVTNPNPNESYVVDCSSWGTVTLVDNPTTMSKLSYCEGSSRYPYCIFVFYDYDENSVPDLRNGTYTMQFRGGYKKNNITYDPTNCFLYYDTSNNNNRMASTANYSNSHPVTNPVTSEVAQNDSRYLWYFKAAEVGGVVDPYDVKIYNAYVGIGDNDYFVADPLDNEKDGNNNIGVGSGPENDYNKLQPKSILNSDKIASYYIALNSRTGQYNITGKPAYNEGSGNTTVRSTVYYNLWAEYQHDGGTTANISKGGITSQSNFQIKGGRENFASIILTRVTYTYKIVDASGNTIVQATTEDNTLEVPDVIKSPLATYTYYGTQQDAIDGTNPLVIANTSTIYVRYTTRDDVLNLKGEIKYNISVGGTNYLYAANETTLSSEATTANNANNTHKWTLTGNDAYQIAIKNVDNSNEITYDVSSGEAVPTLSATGSKFFFHQSASGQYEVVAITSNDYSTTYYTLGLDEGNLKLYSKSGHPFGNAAVQTVFTPKLAAVITTLPAANSLTYNGSNQELVTAGIASNGTMKYRIGDTGSYETSIPTAKDANTYNVYYMAAGDDGYEDFVASEPIEVTINKQSVTVTSGITASDKTYDGTTNATLDCTGAVFVGKIGNDDLTIVSATGTFDNKNVGTVKAVTITGLTFGGTAAGNYTLAESGNQSSITAKITPAALSVTAKNHSIAYGDNPANDGVTYTGFVPGETESVLGGTLAYSYNTVADGSGTPYTNASPLGSYYIIPSGLTSSNYNISFVAGTLTVGQKSLGSGDAPNTGISFSIENGNIVVKDGEKTLSPGVDYTLGTPTTSGRYTTTEVTGIGNYANTLSVKIANVNLMNDGHEGTEWSATFVADGDHALPAAEGITPYIVENIDLSNNTVSVAALDYIPNGVPVLLLSDSNVEGFLVKAPTSYTEITDGQKTDNMLKVATGSESFAVRQIYLLYNNEFVLNMPGALDAGKVYMVNPSYPYSSPARLRINRAQSTGISEIDKDDNTVTLDDRWYNLNGLRLNGKPTKKGIYLKDGKKVVVK